MRHYYYGEPLAFVMMMFLVGIFVMFLGLQMNNDFVALDLGMSQAEAQMHTEVAQIEADKGKAINLMWSIVVVIVGVCLIVGGVAIYFIRKTAQVEEHRIDAIKQLMENTRYHYEDPLLTASTIQPDHRLVDNLRRSAHESGYGFQVVDGYAELLDNQGRVIKRKQLPVAPARQIEMHSR